MGDLVNLNFNFVGMGCTCINISLVESERFWDFGNCNRYFNTKSKVDHISALEHYSKVKFSIILSNTNKQKLIIFSRLSDFAVCPTVCLYIRSKGSISQVQNKLRM